MSIKDKEKCKEFPKGLYHKEVIKMYNNNNYFNQGIVGAFPGNSNWETDSNNLSVGCSNVAAYRGYGEIPKFQ